MTLRQAGFIWLATALVVGCVVVAPRWSEHLLRAGPPSGAARFLLVLASMCATLPVVALAALLVRIADEYHRQLLVTGAALAGGAIIVVYPAFHAAQEAGVVRETQFLPYLPTACTLWVLGTAAAWLSSRTRR